MGAGAIAPTAAATAAATAGAAAPAYGKIETLGTTGANSIFPTANLGVPLSPLPPSALPSALAPNPSAAGTGILDNRWQALNMDYPSAFYQTYNQWSPLSIGGHY